MESTQKTKYYFERLKSEVDTIYSLSMQAKAVGIDPVNVVEIPLAMNMAEKVVGLISTLYPQMQGSGIASRITELEEQYGKLDPTVVFKIAEEVAKQKFCTFKNTLEAMDAGIRVGFCYTTLAVVSSPIEGFTGLKIKKTLDGKEYIEGSFSGPIRSAGTTASCLVLMLIDYMRELFGYAKYDPTEDEIKRVATELEDFHERISNLQYKPTEEEALFLARRMPFQVAGDPSEKIEVSNYKNLARIETNYLRSGFCLVMAEGLAQKAAKGFRLYNMAKKNGVSMTGFDWLKEYVEMHEARNKGGAKATGPPTYIKDLVAGRPVYGHPSRSGSFRFRYGRGRNSGFSATCIHPATMGISDDFLAIGTQLKIEKPTKGCAVTVCDLIEGPIVKFKDGTVKQITDLAEARKICLEIEEILYLGDILFPFSDVANRNYDLVKAGYVEEWWILELKEKNLELAKTLNCYNICFEDAINISKENEISLYPKLIYYWTQINKLQFFSLLDWISLGVIRDKRLILPWTLKEKDFFENGKRALEILGAPHQVFLESVILDEFETKKFFVNLGFDLDLLSKEEFYLKEIVNKINFELNEEELKKDFEVKEENLKKDFNFILEIINKNSKFNIRDKAGDFIGARMGRPEKAKLRKLTGSPNVLFSVGSEGGRLRSIQSACEAGKIKSSFPLFYCEKCDKETIYPTCEDCNSITKQKYYFSETKEKSFDKKMESSEKEGFPYSFQSLDINHFYDKALDKCDMYKDEAPLLVKGIRGTSSEGKSMENLAKGVLRAKYDLQVNKDGTIRMDATELPLTHFKPKEIGTSVSKLIELGYTQDTYGNDLVSEEQIIELMPHDILIPNCVDTPDEKGEDIFSKVCAFIDEELEKLYHLPRFYNIRKKEDLIGQLGICMAPHNCAGVICRFIGFSDTLGLMASPYMHAAIRRDCDGDEAAIMMLTDVLINFSRKFLPSHRGGTQDAPLVLNAKIDPGEVDDQILDLEMVYEYPLDLYQKAEKRLHSSEVKMPTVKSTLKQGKDTFNGMGFTHDTDNFNFGVKCSNYKLLATMMDKVSHQMMLAEKIRAVDTSDTARLIVERHFIRDMKGNLRKFSMQGFRCVACNEIYRRVPLKGKCLACGGKLIFTIHEGGIKKYLEPSLMLVKKYNLSSYLTQNIDLVKNYIDSIFGRETEKQEALSKFF